mmetsp:Transcript_26598/g.37461  ORF Transcript_26598/g.37461 Transcript_26598/m.37461 type:complete len:97 (+) Transcript_26598:27-317(+)
MVSQILGTRERGSEAVSVAVDRKAEPSHVIFDKSRTKTHHILLVILLHPAEKPKHHTYTQNIWLLGSAPNRSSKKSKRIPKSSIPSVNNSVHNLVS